MNQHAQQLLLPLKYRITIECGAARLDDPLHHLRRRQCGLYQLRLTVDRGPKFVGQRVVISLQTRDQEEARARRDLVVEALRKAEVIRESLRI